MGKLASVSIFSSDNLQSAAQKALAFRKERKNNFHPAIRAVTKVELNRYINATSVTFTSVTDDQFYQVKIITRAEVIDINYDGTNIYINRTHATN